jgi:hypothetical protein
MSSSSGATFWNSPVAVLMECTDFGRALVGDTPPMFQRFNNPLLELHQFNAIDHFLHDTSRSAATNLTNFMNLLPVSHAGVEMKCGAAEYASTQKQRNTK